MIVFCTNLSSQTDVGELLTEKGYQIHNLDTLLSYEIQYDSLSRKSRITNYPLFDDRGVVRISDFNYNIDTVIELQTTVFSDTLKMTKTINRDSLQLKIEDKTYGFWTAGKYSKGVSSSIYKYHYDDSNELLESIFYIENGDTIRHNYFENIKESICSGNIKIQKVKNSNGDKTGMIITQNGIKCKEIIDCDSNCTKLIVIKSQESKALPFSSTLRIYIQNGDTTGISRNVETKLADNYHTEYNEHIYYDGSHSHYNMNYYHNNELYLKETFGWSVNKWNLQTTQIIKWNSDKTQKSIINSTYRNDKIRNENRSFVVYEYK